jgi:uncharacterized protein HemX
MKENVSKKTNMFAAIALVGTLGLTIAGFIWLHVEPSNQKYDKTSSEPVEMSLEEKVQLMEYKLMQQQTAINELQEKIKNIESFDEQIKTIGQSN